MKNILLTLAATAAILVGGFAMPDNAEAQRRGWYGGYGYRPYYRSYYRPYYRSYYRPYYGGYYGYYPRYYSPYYSYGYRYPYYGGYYGYNPGFGLSWGGGGVYIY
jgi:hypothetical protein